MKYVASAFSAASAFLSRSQVFGNLATMLKFTGSQARNNLVTLLKYFLFLVFTVFMYAGIFKGIMFWVEGRRFSWITSFYWTLTVMSTLGFGDITFNSDTGRLFSIFVLISGIILLTIVLPFVFIRFFYAPWLEARIHFRTPRELPAETEGHVIICRYESVAQALIKKLSVLNIPYVVMEPDVNKAAVLCEHGLTAVTGEIDGSVTYEALRAARARMVVANVDDATNTNITLTVREVAPQVPIVATAESVDSVDLLELAGANSVLPLKKILGEHLANRVCAEHAHVHIVGSFRDLMFAEFPIHNTPLVGRTLRETRLRKSLGINVVGMWERGRLLPVTPDTVFSESSVPVVVGTTWQINELESYLVIYNTNYNPVLVIGCGSVGYAAAAALKRKQVAVHMIESNPALEQRAKEVADRVFIGNASDRNVILQAGLEETPSVLITTNDDAINIYLCVYCRRLNPQLRIVSRVTHERNLEAIHRAGADFVLSYASLGAAFVSSILQKRELIMLGEGIDMFPIQLPASLVGTTLGASGIGAKTGLNVIAIQTGNNTVTNPPPDMELQSGSEIIVIGNAEQREKFKEFFKT